VHWNKTFEHKIESSYKISHHFCKTVPIFTKFTHNTSVDSLNKHMCCDLRRIATTQPHKRNAASLPPRHLSRYYYIFCSTLFPNALRLCSLSQTKQHPRNVYVYDLNGICERKNAEFAKNWGLFVDLTHNWSARASKWCKLWQYCITLRRYNNLFNLGVYF